MQWLSPLGDTRLSRSISEFKSSFPHSLLNGAMKYECVLENRPQGGRRPCLSKKKQLNKNATFFMIFASIWKQITKIFSCFCFILHLFHNTKTNRNKYIKNFLAFRYFRFKILTFAIFASKFHYFAIFTSVCMNFLYHLNKFV
jgi:hypothetical protein